MHPDAVGIAFKNAVSETSIALIRGSLRHRRTPVPPFGILGIGPALIGLSAYCQALLFQPPLQGRLTKVTADVIRQVAWS